MANIVKILWVGNVSMGFWKVTWQDFWQDFWRVISKTPYSHFRTHSISIVEKYKQVVRHYKWKEIFHVTVKVNAVTCEYIVLQFRYYRVFHSEMRETKALDGHLKLNFHL